jgi:fatty acid desaturase
MAGSQSERRHAIEWPTVAAIVGFWVALASVVVFGRHWPALVAIAALTLLGGFYMSLQHEVIHGHPTPWRLLNRTAVGAPLGLLLPFERYSVTHLAHHASDLTDPYDDPESFYVCPQTWERAGRIERWYLLANRTLAFRLILGPMFTAWRSVAYDMRAVRYDSAVRRTWMIHSVATALVLVAVNASGLSLWIYLVGFVYGGLACTALRSFAEHRAVPVGQSRCAVVRSNMFFGLLFLNNNLHQTHHALPGASWYRMPQLARDLGSADIAAAGAGFYPGYLAVARRYMFRSFEQPVTPLLNTVEA